MSFLHQMEDGLSCHQDPFFQILSTSCSTGREVARFPAIFYS